MLEIRYQNRTEQYFTTKLESVSTPFSPDEPSFSVKAKRKNPTCSKSHVVEMCKKLI